MIGNDIVDLNLARRESNWRRKGFLDKLFTDHEQQLIQSATEPDVLVWTLWSMKESAYKLVVRETAHRFFAPGKLVCQLNEFTSVSGKGSVFFQRTYQTMTLISTHYVTTVAFAMSETPAFAQVVVPFDRTDYQHQHLALQERLKHECATRFSISDSQIQLQKNEAGVPSLLIRDPFGPTITKPISLSHHGHYGAFVML